MRTHFLTILVFVFIGSCIFIQGCDDDDSAEEAESGGCEWNGNCSSIAPEGAYDCDGNSIVQCLNGQWKHVIACGTVQNSGGYYCTCKGGCGTNVVECSYAFDLCAGQEYETCGNNANAEISDGSWKCVSN